MKLYRAPFVIPISSAPLQDGAVLVREDTIEAVGPATELIQKHPKAIVETFENCALMPGLVAAYTQLELKNAPLNPDQYCEKNGEPNFISWLIDLVKYQNALSIPHKKEAILQGAQILAKNGITTAGDWTTYDGASSLYRESGLPVVLFSEVIGLNSMAAQDRFESSLGLIEDSLERPHAQIKRGIALHSPFTVSKNLLKILTQHLTSLPIPVQIHASQSFAEMEFFYDSKGEVVNMLFPYAGWGQDALPPAHQLTPIQYLNSIGFLQLRPALVGCVHLSQHDIDLIEKSKASVIYQPRANWQLKLGKTPIRRLLDQKIPVGFGLESLGEKTNLCLWQEMRTATDSNLKENALSASEALEIATLGGAKILGLDSNLGTLEKGKQANIIGVDLPPDTTLQSLEKNILEKTTSEQITKRLVAGKLIK